MKDTRDITLPVNTVLHPQAEKYLNSILVIATHSSI